MIESGKVSGRVLSAGGISSRREMVMSGLEKEERKHTTQGGQLCCLGVVCEQFKVKLRTILVVPCVTTS